MFRQNHQLGATLVLLGALLACGGGSGLHLEQVPGPGGRPATLISCTSASQCYANAAGICPAGYEIVESDSYAKEEPDPVADWVDTLAGRCKKNGKRSCRQHTKRTQVRELLVQCQPASARVEASAKRETASDPKPQPAKRAPAPAGGVGYWFGASAAECEQRCREQSHDFVRFANRGRCDGFPVELGLSGQVWFSFSADRLVSVEAVVESDAAPDALVEGLIASLRSRYGRPSARDVACAEDLLRCLATSPARALMSWSWPSGQSVTLDAFLLRGTARLRVSYHDARATFALHPAW